MQLADREDADVFPRSQGISLDRRIYPFDPDRVAPLGDAELRGVTVSSLYRVHSHESLADRWLRSYRALLREGGKLYVGKGHTIEAYSPNDEFIHFDLYAPTGPSAPGRWVANNDTIQLIDPTRHLSAPEQTEVAIANALNDLFCLGAVEDVRVYPFYAAPSRTMAERIAHNVQAFCDRHGFTHVPQEPVSENTLLMGATAIGATSRQTPTFYRDISPGDLILVHRPFGDLAPINVLIESLVLEDAGMNGNLPQHGIEDVVQERVETMRQPNLRIGQLIQRFAPDVGEPLNPSRHIKATVDLSGPGIDVFRELAEICGRDVALEQIPLANGDLVRWATQNFLLPNGTAGTNGAIALIASPEVIDSAAAELESFGYQPEVIGQIQESSGSGGTLIVPPEAKNYISDWPENYRVKER